MGQKNEKPNQSINKESYQSTDLKKSTNISSFKPSSNIKANNNSLQNQLKERTKRSASQIINKHLFRRIEISEIETHRLFLEKKHTIETKQYLQKSYKYNKFSFKNDIKDLEFTFLIQTFSSDTALYHRWGPILEIISNQTIFGEILPNLQQRTYKAQEDDLSKEILMSLRVVTFVNENQMEKQIYFYIYEMFILDLLKTKNFNNFVNISSYLLVEDINERHLLLYFNFYDISLRDILMYKFQNNEKIKEDELLSIMKQLLGLLFKLQSDFSLAHRDIKHSNFLWDSKLKQFIINDFSSSIIYQDSENKKLDICGTPFYFNKILIEAYNNKQKTIEYNPFESDMYALGITFLCLKQLIYPEEITSKENLQKQINNINEETCLSSIIIKSMLQNEGTFFSLYSKLSKISDKLDFDYLKPKILEKKSLNLKNIEISADQNYQIGLLYFKLFQYHLSEERLKQSSQQYEELKDYSRKAKVVYFLSIIYEKLNMISQILDILEPSIPYIKKVFTDNEIIISLQILAKSKVSTNKYVDAIMNYEESLLLIEKSKGPFSILAAEINEKMGDIYEILNQTEEAVRRWNESFTIYKKITGNEENENCTKLYDKVTKYHPSEIYEEGASFISSRKDSDQIKKDSISPKSNFFLSNSPNSGGRSLCANEIKLTDGSKKYSVNISPNNDKYNEKYKKSKMFLDDNNKKKNDVLSSFEKALQNEEYEPIQIKDSCPKNVFYCGLDSDFERNILNSNIFKNNSSKKSLFYVQSDNEFKKSNISKFYPFIFHNEFLDIKYKVKNLNSTDEYDLILEIIYENISLYEIYNLSTIIEDNAEVNVYNEKFSNSILMPNSNISNKFYFKIQKTTFPNPIATFSASLLNKDIVIKFRLPSFLTVFSNNLDKFEYNQFLKISDVVLDERKYIFETYGFEINKNILQNQEDLLTFFPNFIYLNDENSFKGVIELKIRNEILKFMLEFCQDSFKNELKLKISLICFDSSKFMDYKTIIFSYLKTLMFLIR